LEPFALTVSVFGEDRYRAQLHLAGPDHPSCEAHKPASAPTGGGTKRASGEQGTQEESQASMMRSLTEGDYEWTPIWAAATLGTEDGTCELALPALSEILQGILAPDQLQLAIFITDDDITYGQLVALERKTARFSQTRTILAGSLPLESGGACEAPLLWSRAQLASIPAASSPLQIATCSGFEPNVDHDLIKEKRRAEVREISPLLKALLEGRQGEERD